MPKFIFTELVDLAKVITARAGAGSGAANNLTDKEVGKFVKQTAESRYDLCVVGNEIEGRISSIETATQDAFTIAGIQKGQRFECTFDGLQATPGTGVVALNDYVVCGTVVAKDTALTVAPRVCKATALTFATTPAVTFPAGSDHRHKWRVVSLGAAGTGAVGTVGLIEQVL